MHTSSHAGNCRIPGVRRILLAMDGTEIREGATRESIALARQCSAILYAVSVIEAPGSHEVVTLLWEEEMPEAEVRNKLEALASEAT